MVLANNDSERVKDVAGRLLKALSRVDDKRPDGLRSLSVTQLLCLFYVASKDPPVRLSEVWRDLGIAGSSGQRSISMLGDFSKGAKSPPLGLVDVKMDVLDRRERTIKLTPKGLRLMRDILEYFPSINSK